MGYIVEKDIKIDIICEIFKYLYPDSNVMLSELSNSDKVYIMYLLKQYYLRMRDKLGLNNDVTFGIEIEFENAFRDMIEKELEDSFSSEEWSLVDDGSLCNGGEINSPILTDNDKTWIDLSYVCDIVNKNAYVMDNTGAHIHIGVQILGNNPKYWCNFAKLWATYENVIFRFLYGEYISPRSQIGKHAAPISLDYISKLERIEDRAKMMNASNMFKVFDSGDEDIKVRRRKSVNFTNVSGLQSYMYNRMVNMNTVEFRSANGTFNPIIWQNNINFIVKLLLYCKGDKFDEDLINKRMEQIIRDGIPSNLYKYSRIYNEQAIELSDMIFDNNLDKIYFLRQYVKYGEVSNNPLVKSRKFTRR